MELILRDKEYKAKINGNYVTGILVDYHFVPEKGESICVLEASKRDNNNEFPLYDIWEHELLEL